MTNADPGCAKCSVTMESVMNLKHSFVAVTSALLVMGSGAANAGQTIEEAGAFACATHAHCASGCTI